VVARVFVYVVVLLSWVKHARRRPAVAKQMIVNLVVVDQQVRQGVVAPGVAAGALARVQATVVVVVVALLLVQQVLRRGLVVEWVTIKLVARVAPTVQRPLSVDLVVVIVVSVDLVH
jgi:hypothetical protein